MQFVALCQFELSPQLIQLKVFAKVQDLWSQYRHATYESVLRCVGRHEVVSLLLDRKANVEHRAKTGLTPLMEAASGGYVEVGRVLLDKGADVNAPPVPSSRDTALTIAADKGHTKFVELLLQRYIFFINKVYNLKLSTFILQTRLQNICARMHISFFNSSGTYIYNRKIFSQHKIVVI